MTNLKLIDYNNNKKVIFNISIGTFNKNGRLLKLIETHDIICNVKHDVTHSHDPVTDVIFTKCIFNYLINKMGPKKLYKICNR